MLHSGKRHRFCSSQGSVREGKKLPRACHPGRAAFHAPTAPCPGSGSLLPLPLASSHPISSSSSSSSAGPWPDTSSPLPRGSQRSRDRSLASTSPLIPERPGLAAGQRFQGELTPLPALGRAQSQEPEREGEPARGREGVCPAWGGAAWAPQCPQDRPVRGLGAFTAALLSGGMSEAVFFASRSARRRTRKRRRRSPFWKMPPRRTPRSAAARARPVPAPRSCPWRWGRWQRSSCTCAEPDGSLQPPGDPPQDGITGTAPVPAATPGLGASPRPCGAEQ